MAPFYRLRHLAADGINFGGECRWTPRVLTESLKNLKTLSRLERLLLDRYAIQRRMIQASVFEGNVRGANFFTHREPVSVRASAAALEALASLKNHGAE